MRGIRTRSALFAGGLSLVAVIIVACLGDVPESVGRDDDKDAAAAASGDSNTATPNDDGNAAQLAFEASISRFIPRDSTLVQVSLKLAVPSSEAVTVQLVNPPVGISSNPREPIPPGIVEDQLELRADNTAVPGAVDLQIVATTISGASATRFVRAIVLGPPGSLDPTLGDGGVMIGGNALTTTRTAALAPPDKLVVGGVSGGKFALGRYRLSDGALDPAFNGGAIVTTAIGEVAAITAIAVQPDGKTVAAGISQSDGGASVAALARYDTTGALDATFGDQGTGYTTFSFNTDAATAEAIAFQSDGKLVIAGDTGPGGNHRVAIARRMADGTPDTTFGSNGIVTTAYGSIITPVTRDVGIGGTATTTRIVVLGSDGTTGAEDFRLVNILLDGGPGVDVGSIDFGARDIPAALHAAPSGGTFVVGTVATPAARIGLARLNTAGKLDTTFADGGRRTHGVHVSDVAASLSIQADGKILIGGRAVGPNATGPQVVRLLASAEVDPTFGANGYASVPSPAGPSEVIKVFPQADGRIIAVLSGKEFWFVRLFP